MAVNSLNLKTSLAYQLLSTNNLFSNVTTAPGATENWSLANLDTTIWDNLFLAEYTVWVTAPSLTSATATSGTSTFTNGTYYYVISGIGPNGPLSSNTLESDKSNEHSALVSGNTQVVTLVWTQLQGATGYNIYRGTGAGLEDHLITTITSGSTLTYTDTGTTGTAQSPPTTPATFKEFDVSSFTNQVGDTVTTDFVLSLFMLPTGTSAIAKLAPGTTNGLTWVFGGTTPTISINGGGALMWSGAVGGTSAGQTVDSTHKTLRVTNTGTGNLSVVFGIIVADSLHA